jgi:hypothetical protein
MIELGIKEFQRIKGRKILDFDRDIKKTAVSHLEKEGCRDAIYRVLLELDSKFY